MDKKYQVFISSTFRDLVEERQAVLKAVLELGHMPAGMELFPACDDSAWQLIKDVIDSSDYYVLIIGGKYGSLGADGIGYTEKEYDYAVIQKKPVIPLLCKDPNSLTREKTETDGEAWEKICIFRKKIEDKHTCKYWTSVDELKAMVVLGLTSSVKRHPGVGWVRADGVPSGDHLKKILELRQKIEQLETEKIALGENPPEGTDDLSQGDDTFSIEVTYKSAVSEYELSERAIWKSNVVDVTWNAIYSRIAPLLISEVGDKQFRYRFRQTLSEVVASALTKTVPEGWRVEIKSIDAAQVDICIIQFRALGLICENKTSTADGCAVTWTLTPYGDNIMTKVIALRRNKRSN